MKLWALGESIQCIQGTFESQVFKVIYGSFDAFPIGYFWHLSVQSYSEVIWRTSDLS